MQILKAKNIKLAVKHNLMNTLTTACLKRKAGERPSSFDPIGSWTAELPVNGE